MTIQLSIHFAYMSTKIFIDILLIFQLTAGKSAFII